MGVLGRCVYVCVWERYERAHALSGGADVHTGSSWILCRKEIRFCCNNWDWGTAAAACPHSQAVSPQNNVAMRLLARCHSSGNEAACLQPQAHTREATEILESCSESECVLLQTAHCLTFPIRCSPRRECNGASSPRSTPHPPPVHPLLAAQQHTVTWQ